MTRRRGRQVGLDSQVSHVTGLAGRVGLGQWTGATQKNPSQTSFKFHIQQRLSPQGYPGRPPTSSWPVVFPATPCRQHLSLLLLLPAKPRCVTHQPPVQSAACHAYHNPHLFTVTRLLSFPSRTPFLPIVPSLCFPACLRPFSCLLLILPSALIRWLGPASAHPLRLADVVIVSLQIHPFSSQPTLPPQRRLTFTTTKA